MQVLAELKELFFMTDSPKGAKTLADVQSTFELADEMYPKGIPGVDQKAVMEYCQSLVNDFGCKVLFDVFRLDDDSRMIVSQPAVKRVQVDGLDKLMLCIGDQQHEVRLDWKRQRTKVNGYEAHVSPSEKVSVVFKLEIEAPSIETYRIAASCALDYDAFIEQYEKQNGAKPNDKIVGEETGRLFALMSKGDVAAVASVRAYKKASTWINPEDFGVTFQEGSYKIKKIGTQTGQTSDGKRKFPIYIASIELADSTIAKVKPGLNSAVAKGLKEIHERGSNQALYLEALQVELKVTGFTTNERGYRELVGELTTIRDRKSTTPEHCKTLWNIAKKAGWTQEDCKGYLLQHHDLESFRDIPIEMVDELREAFLNPKTLAKLHKTSENVELPWADAIPEEVA
jgi:hypothetical protein